MRTAITTAMAVLALAAGCAASVPGELVNARTAYQRMQTTRGAQLAQTDAYEAKKALERAEAAYRDDPRGDATRDLAYIAQRRAIAAEAKGNALAAMEEKKRLENEAAALTRAEAAQTEQQLAASKTQLQQQGQALASEQQARADADRRTREALDRLTGLAAKQDARGLVLTLSGSVLFASGKSTLLPAANARLDQVAKALREDNRNITIVGHTDAQGDDDLNMRLSEKRAEAVRAYLVAQGIDADRIRATGMGESQPVVENTTAEGRANNRRVEIVLNEPTTAPQR